MSFSRIFLFIFLAQFAFACEPALGADADASSKDAVSLAMNSATGPRLDNSIPPLPPAPAAQLPAPTAPASPLPATPQNGTADIGPALITDTSLAQSDLWQRIRNGFAMTDLDSKLIANHERWYASRPDYVARMMERSQRYLYFIEEEVEKRGMPSEIALLPMIESGFNPTAYSISRASGIWQFIPSTGKKYGMSQNWWYDGRRDIISATTGALDYLQKLHEQFGDWQLALAAYNCGEGAVERAQERNRRHGKPTDYASLRLPDETRNYVPKLLAVKNIVSNPEKYGLTLPAIPNRPYFTAVSADKHMDVKLAAKLADISVEEFTALNPAHSRPVILQDNDNVLLLPVDKAETFRSNLENTNEPLVSWQAYHSKKGERLDKVAPRFGLSVAKLKSINGLSPRAKISNGQTLLVPMNGDETDNDFEAFNTHLLPDDPLQKRSLTHTVRKGETLSRIARHYRVSVAALKNWNEGISSVRPGQTLTIVQSRPHRVARAGGKKHVKLAGAKGKKSATRTARNKTRRTHIALNR